MWSAFSLTTTYRCVLTGVSSLLLAEILEVRVAEGGCGSIVSIVDVLAHPYYSHSQLAG